MLVYGVRWPPESFLRLKFERLVARGVRVTVGTSDASGVRNEAGVAVRELVPRDPAGARATLLGAASLLRVFLRSPRRAVAVVRAANRPTAAGRPLGRREARLRRHAYSRAAALRPDVVHFEWNTAAVHYPSLADALGCPVVVSRRGSEMVHPHLARTAKLASGFPLTLARAAVVHCVSDQVREEAERNGLDPAKAWVIRPAVDAELFRPAPDRRQPDGSFRLAAVGSLRWLKGYEYALLAVAELARQGVPVTLDILGGEPTPEIGEPSDLERVRRSIVDLGLEDRVRLHGLVEPASVRDVLHRSDALLHLSLVEGLPNAVLEAMACALPVVVTDVGGTTEAVRDGVEGFVVSPRDPHAAVAALLELWRDPALAARLGAAGRARVEAEFTIDRQTDAWVELYEHVATVAAVRPARPLRLVEVGLRWLPEMFLRRKLQNLAATGFEPRVVSWDTAPGQDHAILPGVARDRVPPADERRLRRLAGVAADCMLLALLQPRRLRAVVSARRNGLRTLDRRAFYRLARLRANIVHFEWLDAAIRLSPLFDAWRAPVAVTCHGGQLMVRPHTPRGERERLHEELPRLFGRAVAVHCVSEAVLRDAERFGLDPAKGWLIRQTVDTELFRPPAMPRPWHGGLRLVSVSWLRWLKGYEYTLLAVAELARQGVPVSLEILGGEPLADIGEPSELDRIRYTIADLGLEERVTVHGLADTADVRAALQRSDALLHMSLSEGLPNVILEAMACALPVVATHVGGTGEAVRHGVEGFLVPPRDTAAAASALHTLWRDPNLRSRMGEAGRARVLAHFRPEDETRGFHELYEAVGAQR